MAIDEALLDCFTPDSDPPILRLYGWSPAAFSFGRFQNPEETIDLDRCHADNITAVRRITGGGIIFHGSELTYSLVVSSDFAGGGSRVKDAFFQLTSFLLDFYRQLGLDADYAANRRTGERFGSRTALCFAGLESCDILINGKKIGGNAQRRIRNIIFQHGSIPLESLTRESQKYLLTPSREIEESTTSLTAEGVTESREQLAAAVAASFSERFRLPLCRCGLTDAEQARAGELIQKSA